ncbi:MAG: long-chain fatty acid--CoA ligase [Verrucomicrobiae bacterium]|nr:long-chain fatty acid--CoA ligase [Verrucomicrobiae bacterium]
MNLATQWSLAASHNPQKPALFWGDASFTHAHLYHQSLWMAAALQRLGVQPGDRVGLWLKNCPEFVPALFGIFMANAVAVPINNFLKPEEVAFMLQDAGIRHLITDTSLADPAKILAEKFPGLTVWLVEHLPTTPAEEQAIPPSPCQRTEQDLAVLIYTSGTTGRPKGAMLTHGNLLHNIRSCQKMLESTLGDRFVLLLPMFHSFMLTVCVLLPLCTGASIVLIKSVHPAKNILMEILRHQGTILPAVPSFFRLFAQAELPPQLPLRLCISGGAALPVEILREFNRKFPLPLLEGYGLSETSPVASLNPIRGPWKEGSIGVPIPDVEMSVQDDQGRFLPPREIGEICIRGGNVMAGYWNQPEATAAVMRNGWFLTGDVGYRDEDGYFYITDRKKDMLIVNGINVYPREIEELIYQYPGIREAAVIGIPDARRGEQPVAYVSLTDGATLDEYALLRYLRDRIAHYKVPRKVTVLPALPRNATGKILKTDLRQMALRSLSPPAAESA